MGSSSPSIDPVTVAVRSQSVIDKILIFVVMLTSGSVFQAVYDKTSLLCLLVVDVIVILKLMRHPASRFKMVGSLTLLLLVGLILGTMIIQNDYISWPQYAYYFNMLLAAFCIVSLLGFEYLVELFDWFMVRATVVSLIGYLAFEVIGLVPFGFVLHNRDVIYDFYFVTSRIVGVSHRLSGFFWEPGQFAAYLIFVIFLYARVMNGRSVYRYILYFVALLLTYSAMAYMVAPILALLVCSNYLGPLVYRRWSFVVTCIAIFAMVFSAEMVDRALLVMPSVFGKVAARDVSFMTRINGALVDVEIFRSNPVWGIGLGHCEEIAYFFSRSAGFVYDARTSTFTTWLMTFGAPTAIVLTGIVLVGWLRNCSGAIESMLFCLILVFVYTSQPLMLSLFSALIAFSCFVRGGYQDRRRLECFVP